MKSVIRAALIGGTTLMSLTVAAWSQTPAAAPAPAAAPGAGAPPGAGASEDPTRLPGDRVMPRGMMPPPPMPTGTKPPPEPGTDAPGPSLTVALAAAQAALAACATDGYKVGVSVIDSSGQPRLTMAADGATGGHVYTGIRKALAALAFHEPTSQVSMQAQKDKNVEAKIAPNMAPMAGAVPLMRGTQVIGAIGVSGASSQQDEKCAIAGAAAIAGKLK